MGCSQCECTTEVTAPYIQFYSSFTESRQTKKQANKKKKKTKTKTRSDGGRQKLESVHAERANSLWFFYLYCLHLPKRLSMLAISVCLSVCLSELKSVVYQFIWNSKHSYNFANKKHDNCPRYNDTGLCSINYLINAVNYILIERVQREELGLFFSFCRMATHTVSAKIMRSQNVVTLENICRSQVVYRANRSTSDRSSPRNLFDTVHTSHRRPPYHQQSSK